MDKGFRRQRRRIVEARLSQLWDRRAIGVPIVLAAVSMIAEAQWGLFTMRQAREAGAPRRDLVRLEQAGVLERIAHGAYLAAAVPRSDLLELKAAGLQLAPGTPIDARARTGTRLNRS
ncbi:type IV toxin-antitoxin system AbiEi family antitoxin domain-containing protein [Actinocorallia sp. B10E7]|uniref:type IV toxin-antitoxin system AbiEi family antitoxin domain-containing protein n=1 Tax=Actinocorallia sp. B10E7 TaxID=3153558 RepID=UPI00325EF065